MSQSNFSIQELKTMIYDEKIQDLLLHMGHIGTSDKIKPMQEFSANFEYCPKNKINDKKQTCFYCYAKDSRKAKFWMNYLDENTDLMLNDPLWVRAMTFYINKIGRNRDFRFFVCGEIPNFNTLKKIMQIVKNCPKTTFWIPTTKHDLIFKYIKKFGPIPENAAINLSWTDLFKKIPISLIKKCKKNGLKISQAVYNVDEINCHADQVKSHKCEYCTKCLEKPNNDNQIINYRLKIKTKEKRKIFLEIKN